MIMKANKLKKFRKEIGLTQAQVAKKAKISTRGYQNYETGERVPNAYTAQLIAQALQTKVEKLFPLSQRNSSDTNLSKE